MELSRFRIPKSASVHENDAKHFIDIEWPTNKKVGRLLCDCLQELEIPYSLTQDNQLYVTHENPAYIKKILQFKVRTFNHSYTHFISLPLYGNKQMQEAFEQIQKLVLLN